MVKKQQLQWTLAGAHLLLQTRRRGLNDELEDLVRQWYPAFRSSAPSDACVAACPPVCAGLVGRKAEDRTAASATAIKN